MAENERVLMGALETWLAGRLDRPVEVTGWRRPGAGQSSETFLFEAASGAGPPVGLVLRIEPGPGHIFPRPDAVLESRVLTGVADAGGPPVPAVIGAETDPAVLGAPFFVMSQIPGRVPPGKPSLHAAGWVAELAPLQRRQLWDNAVSTLVAVHAVPWRDHLAFIDPATSTDGDRTALRVGWLAAWYDWASGGRSYPVTEAALDYLRQAGPGPSDERGDVLVWGDARVGNMIFAADCSVAAVVDWEVATVGRPEIDVAHWLFFDEFATDVAGVPRLDGWPDRDTTVRTYEELAGRALQDLGYFEVMQQCFMSITLIRQSDRRVERGLSAPGSRMGHDNPVTQMMARRLGLEVPDLSPDWLAHRGGAAGAGVSGPAAGGAA